MRQVDAAVLHDVFLGLFSDIQITHTGEELAGDFLGEAFFLVIRVVDGHVQHSLLEALVLAVGVGLDHEGNPFLESPGCEAWDIGSFVELVWRLHQKVLCLDYTKQS